MLLCGRGETDDTGRFPCPVPGCSGPVPGVRRLYAGVSPATLPAGDIMARLVHCERSAEERVKDFGEGYRCLTPEEAIVEARRCVRRACDVANCEIACPLRSDIRQMMQLVAAGDFTQAARVLGHRNNSADICARVCPHDMLCEGHCVLGAEDEPVAIGAVERCVAEWALQHAPPPRPSHRQSGKKIAIVGSGPSGLACAEELVKKGHRVTVFEALPHPGGLLVYGIPGFKVSRAAVERRLNQVRALGVDFVCNTRIGCDLSLDELQKRGYRAIFLATGATEPNEPEIEGRHPETSLAPYRSFPAISLSHRICRRHTTGRIVCRASMSSSWEGAIRPWGCRVRGRAAGRRVA